MRPATDGSIRDIRRARIRSLSRRSAGPGSPAARRLSPVRGTRTRPERREVRRRGGQTRSSSCREPPPPPPLGRSSRKLRRKRGDRIGEFAARSRRHAVSPRVNGFGRNGITNVRPQLDTCHVFQGHGVATALAAAVDDEEDCGARRRLRRAHRAAAPYRAPSATSGRRQ